MSDVRHAGMPTLTVLSSIIPWRDASAHAAADTVNEAAGGKVPLLADGQGRDR